MNEHKDFQYIKILEETGAQKAERQLKTNPVQGNFDAKHLSEIHRRIFQHMEKNGYGDLYKPGQYRANDMPALHQEKDRPLVSMGNKVVKVAYAPMNEVSKKEIDEVLKRADPKELSKLKPKEFTKAIGNLYADLDYRHPFKDGNSRTLRVYTEQVAKEAGYNLNWNKFKETQLDRDNLYLARDVSVNQRALPEIKNEKLKEKIVAGLDQFKKTRSLNEELQHYEAVRPSRAVVFEKYSHGRIPAQDAAVAHPELKEPLKVMSEANSYCQRKGLNPATQQAVLSEVYGSLQTRLDQGQTRDFKPAVQQEVKQEVGQEKSRDIERER